jgi:DegV family protein with EDD domain
MVKIVTDSTSDLPKEFVQKHNIAVVPLTAIFGSKSYRDGVDLSPKQFYDMLPTAQDHPTTSQPTPSDFAAVYRPLVEAGHEIVSLHLSSKLSGTYASAIAAKNELETQLKKSVPITVIDTTWISMALGMLVITAAQAAEAGKSRDEIVAMINAIIPKMNLIFVLDTLEYLKRGGRIGGARAMLGTVLNVKPMLEVVNGVIEPLEQPRSRAKALRRLMEIFDKRADAQKPLHAGVLHAVSAEDAAALEKQIKARPQCKEFYLTEIGAVIGVHVGPNALGLAFYSE